MIVEIVTSAIAGGAATQVFRWLSARRGAELTEQQQYRKAMHDIVERYQQQLYEQAERHRAEIETQARRYEAQLKEAASKLAEQIARADAAELESERERSRRREAERERDEKSAQLLRTQTALDTVNERVVAALKRIEELERDRRPSGEHRAVSPESGAERERK